VRSSSLRDRFAGIGASFEERSGVEVCSLCSDLPTEYGHVRDAVGVTDFSFMQKFRVPEETAIDFLDNLVAGNVAKVRFGRVLHTFLGDDEGNLVADCYVANNDEEFIVLCESLASDAQLDDILKSNGAADAGVEDLTESHALLNVDGYKAWAVVKELFGSDVLGLPYLSIETYAFDSTEVRLFRAGKTSEFGYSIMVPREKAARLLDRVLELASKQGGGPCGLRIHNELRLEGRFFNIYAEGAGVKDPLALGLQWMIDFDKDSFVGRSAIMQRREAGVAHKIVGVRADSAAEGFAPDGRLYDDEKEIARIVSSCYSYILSARIGLALFPREIAYPDLPFRLDSPQGSEVRTISMPPIMPKSLTVKLDEL
jgi:aminomethyltransferase